jgi:carboxypeptidase Taq
MASDWDRLLERLRVLRDLGSASSLLTWDQAVMMPPGGAIGRAQTLATLEAIAHERLTDPAIGELIDALADADLDQWQRAHVRVLAHDYERAVRVPADLVRAIAEARGLAYPVWTRARPANDWRMFEPPLNKLINLKKQEADAIGYDGERYDALLDMFEPETTTAEIESIFYQLVTELRPISEAILEAAGQRPAWLTGDYDERAQQQFCAWLVERLGFTMAEGRLDTSPHPFTQMIAYGDVRQTTRTHPKTILPAIFAAIHETGHALYDLGYPKDHFGLPAGGAPSLGIHESQSRMWENQVGRRASFCAWMLPNLKERFGHALGSLTPEQFHRGVNHPERSLIRVDADEVTYNLHIALRFELELELFRDKLEVSELPEAWNDGMERHLGIRPESDVNGVLQDVHWSIGALGYFPTYTLGTLYAAAFFDVAQRDLDGLDADFRKGDCSRLLDWLREKVHSNAYLYPARELGRMITGAPQSVNPFLNYVKSKYGEIYEITF